jgi:mannose-6-phosphate isomerase-like protein (cupin superfamily)
MPLSDPTELRPWGAFQNLYAAEGFLVKLIEVAPGGRLSLQRHFKREERWIVVSGEGTFTLDDAERQLRTGDMVHVPLAAVHRVANAGPVPLVLLELQAGECREEDIERLADDYARVPG